MDRQVDKWTARGMGEGSGMCMFVFCACVMHWEVQSLFPYLPSPGPGLASPCLSLYLLSNRRRRK